MPPKLFYNDMHPGVRAVLMTAKALTLELELHEVDIYRKDQIHPELIKINPDHTVPTLVDNDFISSDTYTIIEYLVNKHGTTDANYLYPKDCENKEIIDQKLFFNSDVLNPRINSVIAIILDNEKKIPTEKISAITEAYKILDNDLENKTYLAGDNLTVADLCCLATISTATILIPISTEKYPNLSHWYRMCKNLDYYEKTNGIGLNKLDALVEFNGQARK